LSRRFFFSNSKSVRVFLSFLRNVIVAQLIAKQNIAVVWFIGQWIRIGNKEVVSSRWERAGLGLTPVDLGSSRQGDEPRLASGILGVVLELMTTMAVSDDEEEEDRKTKVWLQRN